jgi:hypothetical protein
MRMASGSSIGVVATIVDEDLSVGVLDKSSALASSALHLVVIASVTEVVLASASVLLTRGSASSREALASASHLVVIATEVSLTPALVELSGFKVGVALSVVIEVPLASAHLVVVVAASHSHIASSAFVA